LGTIADLDEPSLSRLFHYIEANVQNVTDHFNVSRRVLGQWTRAELSRARHRKWNEKLIGSILAPKETLMARGLRASGFALS
jgi:hypothetical protein